MYADRVFPFLSGIRDYTAHAYLGKYADRSKQFGGNPAVLVEMGFPGSDFWYLYDCH